MIQGMIHSIGLVWIISEMILRSMQSSSFPYVTWEAETRIIRLGETVVLTCTVHEIDTLNLRETRQWSRESKLVCYNGQPTNPLKYMESLNGNKFKLCIYNVTEADLNCNYQCLYSFETYSKILEITTENFEYPPTVNIKDIEYNYTSNSMLNVKLHLKKVSPLPNCTIIFEVVNLSFTGRTYTQKGLYFDVKLVHQSHIVFNESTQFNISCVLLEDYVITTGRIIIDEGDMHTTDSGEPSYSPDVSLAISLPMIGVIVVIAVCISIKRCYKKYELRYSEGETFPMSPQKQNTPESQKNKPSPGSEVRNRFIENTDADTESIQFM